MVNYTNSTASIQVKSNAGYVFGVFVSSTTSGTLKLYDTATSNTSDPAITGVITVAAGTTYLNIPTGVYFNKGLYVELANTANFTVLYN